MLIDRSWWFNKNVTTNIIRWGYFLVRVEIWASLVKNSLLICFCVVFPTRWKKSERFVGQQKHYQNPQGRPELNIKLCAPGCFVRRETALYFGPKGSFIACIYLAGQTWAITVYWSWQERGWRIILHSTSYHVTLSLIKGSTFITHLSFPKHISSSQNGSFVWC